MLIISFPSLHVCPSLSQPNTYNLAQLPSTSPAASSPSLPRSPPARNTKIPEAQHETPRWIVRVPRVRSYDATTPLLHSPLSLVVVVKEVVVMTVVVAAPLKVTWRCTNVYPRAVMRVRNCDFFFFIYALTSKIIIIQRRSKVVVLVWFGLMLPSSRCGGVQRCLCVVVMLMVQCKDYNTVYWLDTPHWLWIWWHSYIINNIFFILHYIYIYFF